MKLIRTGVFETNSSSCHSVSISTGGNYEGLTPDKNGMIYITVQDFTTVDENCTDTLTKLAFAWYLAEDCPAKVEQLTQLVKSHTGCTDIGIVTLISYPWGWCANSSNAVTSDIFESDLTLKGFVFGTQSSLS